MKLKKRIPVSEMMGGKEVAPKKRVFEVGDWVDDYYCGNEVSEDELDAMVGELVIIDCSTQAHPWHKVCQILDVAKDSSGYRHVFYTDGQKGRSSLSTMFLRDSNPPTHRSYIWRINEGGPTIWVKRVAV